MSDWRAATLGEVVTFQRGFDITRAIQRPGTIPVVSSGGISSYHDTPAASGPGVVIGRKGTLGKTFYLKDGYWPHDTTLWVKDFKGSDPRFVYYFMSQIDVSWLDAGSANPTLNRNHLHPLPVLWPPLPEQQAIAEVLSALDDKIETNTNISRAADQLAGHLFDQAALSIPTIPMSEVLTPVLGGTPARANLDFWNGEDLWASAKDITRAPFAVVVDTEEKITQQAVEQTKAKPLPAGSVVLTARGTVGAVARLAVPSSFNQSCYGFFPRELPPGLLYFSVLRAAQRAKSLAHGSVFDSITMRTFDHLHIPDFGDTRVSTESQISPLLDLVSANILENAVLARTRDALLPQLMSGKLRIKDAKSLVETVV